MKKIIIFLIIISVGTLLIFVWKSDKEKLPEDKYSKEIVLEYKTNGGVPYEWKYEISDTSIVSLKKIEEPKNPSSMPGASINKKYIFKGLKEGNAIITFRYIDIRNKSVTREEFNYISVNKNNEIKLVKKSV